MGQGPRVSRTIQAKAQCHGPWPLVSEVKGPWAQRPMYFKRRAHELWAHWRKTLGNSSQVPLGPTPLVFKAKCPGLKRALNPNGPRKRAMGANGPWAQTGSWHKLALGQNRSGAFSSGVEGRRVAKVVTLGRGGGRGECFVLLLPSLL